MFHSDENIEKLAARARELTAITDQYNSDLEPGYRNDQIDNFVKFGNAPALERIIKDCEKEIALHEQSVATAAEHAAHTTTTVSSARSIKSRRHLNPFEAAREAAQTRPTQPQTTNNFAGYQKKSTTTEAPIQPTSAQSAATPKQVEEKLTLTPYQEEMMKKVTELNINVSVLKDKLRQMQQVPEKIQTAIITYDGIYKTAVSQVMQSRQGLVGSQLSTLSQSAEQSISALTAAVKKFQVMYNEMLRDKLKNDPKLNAEYAAWVKPHLATLDEKRTKASKSESHIAFMEQHDQIKQSLLTLFFAKEEPDFKPLDNVIVDERIASLAPKLSQLLAELGEIDPDFEAHEKRETDVFQKIAMAQETHSAMDLELAYSTLQTELFEKYQEKFKHLKEIAKGLAEELSTLEERTGKSDSYEANKQHQSEIEAIPARLAGTSQSILLINSFIENLQHQIKIKTQTIEYNTARSAKVGDVRLQGLMGEARFHIQAAAELHSTREADQKEFIETREKLLALASKDADQLANFIDDLKNKNEILHVQAEAREYIDTLTNFEEKINREIFKDDALEKLRQASTNIATLNRYVITLQQEVKDKRALDAKLRKRANDYIEAWGELSALHERPLSDEGIGRKKIYYQEQLQGISSLSDLREYLTEKLTEIVSIRAEVFGPQIQQARNLIDELVKLEPSKTKQKILYNDRIDRLNATMTPRSLNEYISELNIEVVAKQQEKMAEKSKGFFGRLFTPSKPKKDPSDALSARIASTQEWDVEDKSAATFHVQSSESSSQSPASPQVPTAPASPRRRGSSGGT